jgi:hypothetical protein
MENSVKFITRDYPISGGLVLDIAVPAGFIGLRSSMGRILLRAVSQADTDQVQRFEFLVLAVGQVTEEPIAYDLDHHWVLLGMVGSRTVYYRQLFD